MTDTDPIKRAQTLITDLNKAYQACKQASADDVRFQEQLNSILGFLAKAETVDNRVLIELEKFYQTSSLIRNTVYVAVKRGSDSGVRIIHL